MTQCPSHTHLGDQSQSHIESPQPTNQTNGPQISIVSPFSPQQPEFSAMPSQPFISSPIFDPEIAHIPQNTHNMTTCSKEKACISNPKIFNVEMPKGKIIDESYTINEALSNHNWKSSMNVEFQRLQDNKT